MKIRLAVIGGLVVSLGACFNKDEGGANTDPVQKATVLAVAVLEEVIEENVAEGQIDVGFVKQSQKARSLGRPLLLNRATQSPQCEVITQPNAPRAATEYVSGGRIEFSPINDTTLLEIAEGENHLYHREIPGSLPDGYYQIQATGGELVPGFRAFLSMPERIAEATVNGTSFFDSIGAIKKSEPVVLEWKSPNFGVQRNLIIMDFIAQTATETTQVECLALERDLNTDGNLLRWSLPKVYIQQLPASATARILLARAHIEIPGKFQNLEAEMQGIRTQSLGMIVAE